MPGRFVPRERKHKRLAKQQAQRREQPSAHDEPNNPDTVQNGDSNAYQISTTKGNDREQRRRALQSELRPESKMSSKKRKRLDKYIDTKLRREENRELLKKLEASQVDTSLFQSSKKLGRVNESKRERLQRALKERSAGVAEGEDILFEPRKRSEEVEDNDDGSEDADDSADGPNDEEEGAQKNKVQKSEQQIASFGSGLKRPLDLDESGRPVLKQRKRRKKTDPLFSASVVYDRDEEDSELSDDAADGHASLGESEDTEGEEYGDEWLGFDSEVEEAADTPSDAIEDRIDSDSEDVEESVTDTSSVDDDNDKSSRVSAFKQWADSQRNAAVGFTPSSALTDMSEIKANFKPRAPSPDPLLPQMTSTTALSRPAGAITIPRSEEVQTSRLELPVVQEEQKIMEAIHNNPVVVVCGATGSGKTTQIPQMLLENGYGSRIGSGSIAKHDRKGSVLQSHGMIGITQPRRVAATSVADRVAQELGPEFRKRVAHQVRYDTNVSRDTAIKFMTDGILLREIQQDFILSKYSAVVLDEAHERSVNTDILIGILSRIVALREQLSKEEPGTHYPLKLIIMSATLRINDFLGNDRLFKNGAPPVVEAEGRQYPVTIHFSRRTRRDYVEEMVEKVARGHRKLPPGGVLVFLTGQQEIQAVAKKLRERLGGSAGSSTFARKQQDTGNMPLEMDDFEDSFDRKRPSDYLEGEEDRSDDDSDVDVQGVDGEGDDEFAVPDDSALPRSNVALKPYILPLYAALPAAQQLKVFQPAPDGHRQIVLATNVAETSLTIPGIRYVFDCGRSKEKRCDSSNVQTFEIDWISKASAAQRTGRAGRTGPGHCYRLYSSAVYENYFQEYTIPEILRTPLESTVLQLKAMDIDNVVNFPFPTPPDRGQLAQAERLLKNLGAIDEKSGKITDRGKDLARFPLSPRYGVMLLLAAKNGMIDQAVGLVAGLAVGDLYIPEMQATGTKIATKEDDDSKQEDDHPHEDNLDSANRHQAYTRAHAKLSRWDDQSDGIKLLATVAAHAASSSNSSSFCAEFFLREKGMQEVQQLRHQLHTIVTSHLRMQSPQTAPSAFSARIPPPSDKDRAMLNQITAAGFIDQIAVRVDLLPSSAGNASSEDTFGRKPRRAVEVPYRTLVLPSDRSSAQGVENVYIHPSSVLARLSVSEMPAYIVYSHLSRAAPSTISSSVENNSSTLSSPHQRTRIHPLTTIGPKALAALAEGTPLLGFGKPVGKVEEMAGKKRQCWVGIYLKAPSPGLGAAVGESRVMGAGIEWPLGAWKVLQKKGGRGVWEVEKVLAR